MILKVNFKTDIHPVFNRENQAEKQPSFFQKYVSIQFLKRPFNAIFVIFNAKKRQKTTIKLK